jgi:hypothetical protein
MFPALALVAIGGVGGAAHPADRPLVSHCHAKIEKPQVNSKNTDSPDSAAHRGGNNQSITTGVTVNCKPTNHGDRAS